MTGTTLASPCLWRSIAFSNSMSQQYEERIKLGLTRTRMTSAVFSFSAISSSTLSPGSISRSCHTSMSPARSRGTR